MAYREGLAREEAVGPAWIDLSAHRLSPASEQRLKERLAESVLARGPAPPAAARGAFAVGVLFACTALFVMALAGAGVVDSAIPRAAVLASVGYGAIAVLIARLSLAYLRGREGPDFWLFQGLVLVPSGVLAADGMHLRIAPADRIVEIEWATRERALRVRFDDGSTIDVPVVRRDSTALRQAITAVLARGEDIRRARAIGDARALESLELLSRAEIEDARIAPPRARRLLPPRPLSLAWGVSVALLAYLVILPALSIASAPRDASVERWRAISRTYPLPWVESRADAAISARRRLAHEAILARLAPSQRESVQHMLTWLSAHDQVRVDVVVSSPEVVLAPLLREVGPGVPYALRRDLDVESSIERPDVEAIAERLRPLFAAPPDVLELHAGWLAPDDDGAARLVFDLTARIAATLPSSGGVLVALELTFDPRIELRGEAPLSLGGPIVVGEPDRWDLVLRDDGAGARPLDYAIAVEHGAMLAATVLADRLAAD